MKKSLVALAVLGALSGLAQADSGSVTLYGIVDAGFMSVSKTGTYSPGSNGTGSVIAFQDAQILPSIYGIKGSEDLGGGLKAAFNLEGGFSTSNGTHNSPGVYQNQTFGREAKVTLGADWGTFGAGLQVDPALIAAIGTEPRGMTDSLSSLEYWIIATLDNPPSATGAVPAFGSLTGGIFDQNAISYTYSGNGLYLGLIYSFGGVAGSTAAASGESIGASYKNSGFIVSAGYAESKSNIAATATTAAYTGTGSEIDFVGAGYEFAPFAVRVQYQQFKSLYDFTGNNASDVKDLGVGFDWTMGANKLNLAYYNAKDDGASFGGKATEIALLDTYGLSKRTSIYGQLASVKTDLNSGLASLIGGIYTPGSATGASAMYIGLGVQHTF